MKRNKMLRVISLVLVIILLNSLVGCKRKDSAEVEETPAVSLSLPAVAASFAVYREGTVNVNPSVPFYKATADLSNVTNGKNFEFSPEALQMLTSNGFVVTPKKNAEFFMVYEMNRYDGVPNFITTDSMMHNYHLFFNHLLKSIESGYLIPELKNLNKAMLETTGRQYQELKGTAWENAAKRNLAFFAVGSRLLDPAAQVPDEVRDLVDRELALVDQHGGIAVSPVMSLGQSQDVVENLKEDYTQYIPRGHYAKTEDMQRYFKTMMWYGRLTFRLKNEDETKSAVLITLAVNQGDNLKTWEKIYEPTCFFVGKSDDLGCIQYQDLLNQTYGQSIVLKQVVDDTQKWQQFVQQTAALEPPAINSIPIFDETIQPDREKEIKGFRFMGQRFTLDASIFQRLVYREVQENPKGEQRMLPKGLDIPAAMGSDTAYSILKEAGETGYANYSKNMDRTRTYIAGLNQSTWTQNLYWSWLYTLSLLGAEKPEGYPAFMRNQAWARKELATYLGSWTELKHDTILYAKPVYAEMGGGDEPFDDRGYVEPNPYLFNRLAALADMTRVGLADRGMLGAKDQESLQRIAQLSVKLKEISEKELNNTPLSTEDYDLIRSCGGQLEHFWLEAMKDEGVVTRSQLWDNPAPLVADVANDPAGTVLEEGTGYISDIYVVVPIEGKLRIARGGVYSYHEFSWPAEQRLTDEEWHKMLDEDRAPQSPEWTRSFTAEGPVRALSPMEIGGN